MKADTTFMRAIVAGAVILAGAGASAEEVNLYTSREPGLVEPLLQAFTMVAKVNPAVLEPMKNALKQLGVRF